MLAAKRPLLKASAHEADGLNLTDVRRTVLIVEDDIEVRAMLVRVLAPTLNVSIAVDGEAALWLAARPRRWRRPREGSSLARFVR
jgi:hypothetical protein